MKLTKTAVSALHLPPGKADAIFFDDEIPGFGLRMRAGSPRSEARWLVQYKIGDKHRRLTFGKLGELDPAKARDKARDLLSAVRLGGDPAGTKLEARARADETFGVIVERFLARQEGRLRPSSYAATERYLQGLCKPLCGLALAAVTRSTVAARLTAIANSNGPVSADRCRAALGAFFTWAMREGLVDANPTIATNTHSDARARDRVLTDAELAEIWHSAPANDYGRIVRLLILTGQRREEIAALRWSEIYLDNQMISLPGERTKNHRPHEVPLSDSALDVIGECPRRAGRDLVFGEGQGPFSGWSKAKAALDKAMAPARAKRLGKKTGAPWRLHDVRRTVATRMADLGVQPHIVEAVLNHVSGTRAGVAGVYNRAIYAAEKAAALTLWADHVRSIVEGVDHKIVPLRATQ
jgi:integrase